MHSRCGVPSVDAFTSFFGRPVGWSGLHSSDCTENPAKLLSSEIYDFVHFVGPRCTVPSGIAAYKKTAKFRKPIIRRHSIQPVRLATYYRRQMPSIDPMPGCGRRLIIGWETSECLARDYKSLRKALKEADLFARLARLIAWHCDRCGGLEEPVE
jgi:hypothetical protein